MLGQLWLTRSVVEEHVEGLPYSMTVAHVLDAETA